MAVLPHEYADLASIARAIEQSPIWLAGLMSAARRPCALRDLPTGYELTDVIILDWIAAEAPRVRHSYLPL
jgi:hypothetical protein